MILKKNLLVFIISNLAEKEKLKKPNLLYNIFKYFYSLCKHFIKLVLKNKNKLYNYNINWFINKNLIITKNLNINSNINMMKKMLIGKKWQKVIK